jgi:CRP-like cAMP-binding protein
MLEAILKNIGHFSASDLQLFEKELKQRRVAKNEIILNEGIVCQTILYVVSGAIYQFKIDDIDEKVIDLHIADDWCLSYTSFISQKPSTTTIKAYSTTEVLEISIESVHRLIQLSPSFFQLGKVLEHAVSRTRYIDDSLSPLQKYKQILAARPQLLQEFPLKLIASYLGITPETLSRVRSMK